MHGLMGLIVAFGVWQSVAEWKNLCGDSLWGISGSRVGGDS